MEFRPHSLESENQLIGYRRKAPSWAVWYKPVANYAGWIKELAVLPVDIQDKEWARGCPPTSKRINRDWKLFSRFLKKKLQREAIPRLHAADDGKERSDVLWELLENWLKAS